MSFQLDPSRSTSEEIRRVAGEQLDGAIADLVEPGGSAGLDAKAVHDARKRLKKTRSLVRLGRADLGARFSRQVNVELRDAGRALSARRDTDVMIETVQRLLTATDDPRVIEPLTLTRERLDAGSHGAFEPAGQSLASTSTIARGLTRTRERLVARPNRAAGWKMLEPGLRRQYAAGREALAGLGSAAPDEAWHDWRKRTKDHWYHLRLLHGAWPEVIGPLSYQASDLADLLGDDHDLSVLAANIAANPPPVVPHTPVQAFIAGEQARLRAQARILGRRLFADAPGPWASRIGTWWKLAAGGNEPSLPSVAAIARTNGATA